MKAELKSIFSPDVPNGLENWSPPDPSNFALSLMVFIGSEEREEADSFDIVVCSPSWVEDNWDAPLLNHYRLGSNLRLGRGLILMKRWSYQDLEKAILQICDVEAETWGRMANRIGRALPWEFDYKFDKRQDEGKPFP